MRCPVPIILAAAIFWSSPAALAVEAKTPAAIATPEGAPGSTPEVTPETGTPAPPPFGVRNLYLDASLAAGYSSVNPEGGYSSPTLAQFGVGVTPGYWLGRHWGWDWLWVGATTDFRLLNQYSNSSESGGNFWGYYWNIVSPTIGAHVWRLKLKLDVEVLGRYWLGNQTSDAQDTEYASPLGARLTVLHALPWFRGVLKDRLHGGVQAEYVSFSTRTTGGVDTPVSDFSFWQVGLAVVYVF